MIIKNYEIKKKINDNVNFFLLYGSNIGLIEETIDKILKPIFSENLFIYDEIDILKNKDQFFEEILNKSFFENEKLLIINRATDKIFNIIEAFVARDLHELKVIIKSGTLDKKSKLRAFFEKNENTFIIPFYEDTYQEQANIVINFFRNKKIAISTKSINLILERVKGNRIFLNNEIQKIFSYYQTRKKIEFEDVQKLVNQAENHNTSDLVDMCLIKNKTKVLKIINDSFFSLEDNIAITRVFLSKLKRLKIIQKKNLTTSNLDVSINSIKPPIFWKDKETVKNQTRIWPLQKINDLIKKINEIELKIKKDSQISSFIVLNFIMDISG